MARTDALRTDPHCQRVIA
jgi:hypothetical protein